MAEWGDPRGGGAVPPDVWANERQGVPLRGPDFGLPFGIPEGFARLRRGECGGVLVPELIPISFGGFVVNGGSAYVATLPIGFPYMVVAAYGNMQLIASGNPERWSWTLRTTYASTADAAAFAAGEAVCGRFGSSEDFHWKGGSGRWDLGVLVNRPGQRLIVRITDVDGVDLHGGFQVTIAPVELG